MYQPPRAERLIPESEEIMDLDLLLLSNDTDDETDNRVGIDDLLNGLK